MQGLDRVIDIFLVTEVRDDHGQPVQTLSVSQTNVPAMKVYRGGKNEFLNDQMTYTDRQDYKIRWDDSVTEKMIVSDGENGSYYLIEDINELGRRDGMQLVCTRMTTT